MSLPVFDTRFFTANKPSANFFKKWKEQGAWNEGILPIYEWGGLVYIALDHAFYLQQDTETIHAQFSFPHVLLFAPSAELKSIWQNYHQVAPVPTEKQTPASSSSGEQIFDMDTIAQATGTTSEPEVIAAESISPTENEIPEGLQIQANANSSKSSSPSVENDDPFATLTTTPAQQTSEETVFDSPTALTQTSNPSIKVSPQSGDWAESFFDKLNSHFPYSLIFLVSENQAMPWKWSSSLKSEDPSDIDLTKPSPFYVVNRTQQSYHGPVADSSEVRKFCQEWNLKNYPQHMTATPIKVNDRLIGILVAIGESEHYQNPLLQLCESCAREIADLIQQQPQILKAA